MLRQSQAWDSFQNFMRSLKGSSDLRDFFVVCLSCCGFQNSAPFVFELLSAALIYTSLATRIQAVDEPANNRTQQPLAGCWARTFWHNEAYGKGWSEDYHGSGDCNHLAYDACINRYVFDWHRNKFGACQWWRGKCAFSSETDEPPLPPEECDKSFIEQNILGGYTKWYGICA